MAQARSLQATRADEVSRETGVEVKRLLAIESGAIAPSGDELLILANYYARDYRDFIDSSRPEPFRETDLLYRRHGDTFSAGDRKAIQEFLFLCEIEASLQKELGVRITPFSFSPTKKGTHKQYGTDAAMELRKVLGHQKGKIPIDVYADFRRIGYHVFRRRLATSEISGLYIYHPLAGHCVLVNYHEDVYRQRFSVSHEAAHAIFDSVDTASVSYERQSKNYSQRDLKEIRANTFASTYLLPPELLPEVKDWDNVTTIGWANKLRVSTSALSFALLSAGRIDSKTAEQIRAARVPRSEKIDPEAPSSLNATQLNRRKQLLERGLSDYYVGLCFEAQHAGLISSGRLCEALLADHKEMREISVLYGRNVQHEL
ncbi:hypothetical protein QWC_02634 [Achromobacter marplatensis]|nr:hypothetical protein QWC_02634 [Achromobacter marplatensis]